MSDYQYLDDTGVIVPDTETILIEVQNEYKSVFGADLVVTPDTPQGALITAETLSRTEVVKNNAALANQINPNIAGGIFLDAIMAFTGIERTVATKTLVSGVTITGVASTVIAAGAMAKTTGGDIFQLLNNTIIPSGGTVLADFVSDEFGPISCPIGELTQIVTPSLGWETVNNTTAGVLGSNTQSDIGARSLRNNTLGFQGVALPVAIISALYATAGVNSLSFLENYNSVPMGLLVSITGGTTLSGQIWGTTDTGTITIGTSNFDFAHSLESLPAINPWPVAAFSTTGNISLSGLATQGGGDWPATLTAGVTILVKNQTSPINNGLYVAASGAWARLTGYTTGTVILGSNMGISMPRNSIYACVDGGSDTDVAAALLENKSSGCAWVGNQSVPIVEPASGQTYTVLFDRPVAVPILIRVTTTNGNTNNIKSAILAYINGEISGDDGWNVGTDVSPWEIAGAINILYPGTFISKVEITTVAAGSFNTNVIPIAVNQLATADITSITVNVVP